MCLGLLCVTNGIPKLANNEPKAECLCMIGFLFITIGAVIEHSSEIMGWLK